MKRVFLGLAILANFSCNAYASSIPRDNHDMPGEHDTVLYNDLNKSTVTSRHAPMIFTEGKTPYLRNTAESLISKEKLEEMYKTYRTGATFMDDKFFLYAYLLSGEKEYLKTKMAAQ